MKRVLMLSSGIVFAIYSIVGYFAFATWSTHGEASKIAKQQNILLAPYNGSFWVSLSQIAILTAVILVTPL